MLKKLISGGATVSFITICQVITLFIVQVSLARILEPSEFGVFAFISLVTMFINSFGSLHGDRFLIKEKKNSHKILDTIFTIELICLTDSMLKFPIKVLIIFLSLLIKKVSGIP